PDTLVLNRLKDATTATGQWLSELTSPDPWFKNTLPDFRIIPTSALPPTADSATAFTSVCINTALYLPYLTSQCLRNGCTVSRSILAHIADASALHSSGKKADVVVNCTGLSASKLGGVMDKSVIPARGQIVVVRNEAPHMLTISGTDDGDEEVCYIISALPGEARFWAARIRRGIGRVNLIRVRR
ncbi:D-amino-acid oxidase, partial [Lachnellula subtilissima]